jgi:predicted enzyme related to lactoylglutathione lyase
MRNPGVAACVPTFARVRSRRITTMKLKSAAGSVCYVKDLPTTVEFYEKLGFTFKTKEPERATAYVNWWWVDFHRIGADDAPASHGAKKVANGNIGALFYFSVENVQQAYDEVVAAGFEPASEPVALRGNKEFVIVDPDGYRLVFFKRK